MIRSGLSFINDLSQAFLMINVSYMIGFAWPARPFFEGKLI